MFSYGSNENKQNPVLDIYSSMQVVIPYAGYENTILVVKNPTAPPKENPKTWSICESNFDLSTSKWSRSSDTTSPNTGSPSLNGTSLNETTLNGIAGYANDQSNKLSEILTDYPQRAPIDNSALWIKKDSYPFVRRYKVVDVESRRSSFNELTSRRSSNDMSQKSKHFPARQEIHIYGTYSNLGSHTKTSIPSISSNKSLNMRETRLPNLSIIHNQEHSRSEIEDLLQNFSTHRNTSSLDDRRQFNGKMDTEGWLSKETNETVNTPAKYFFNENINGVYCGKNFAIAVSNRCRRLWINGTNPYLQAALSSIPEFTNSWQPIHLSSRLSTSILTSKEYVKLVACGGNHALIVLSVTNSRGSKSSDTLYTIGNNKYGQLGYIAEKQSQLLSFKSKLGDGSKSIAEKLKKSTVFKSIEKVACGASFSVIVSQGGNIYTSGENTRGQCGLGYVSEKSFPFKKATIPNIDFKLVSRNALNNFLSGSKGGSISHLACGNDHTVLCHVSHGGKHRVFAWGYNKFGQCGAIESDGTSKLLILAPREIVHPLITKVKCISCGGDSTVILTEDENILVCGSNRYFQLCNNATTTPPKFIPSLQLEVKPFQTTHNIMNIVMGSNHIIYMTSERPFQDKIIIRRNNDTIPGFTSADCIPTIYENLFNDRQILSSNPHVKLALFFIYTGMLPKLEETTCNVFVSMLHATRISLHEIEKKYNPKMEQSFMAFYALLKKLESYIENEIMEYLSAETVTSLLCCIDSVSGAYKSPKSLEKEYLSFLKFCRKIGVNQCKNYEQIPSSMKIKMFELPIEEDIFFNQIKRHESKKRGIDRIMKNAEQTFNRNALDTIWANIHETADAHILYNGNSIPVHSWMLALVSPRMNKFLIEKYVNADKCTYFVSDASLSKTVQYLSEKRTSLFNWIQINQYSKNEVYEKEDIVNLDNSRSLESPFIIDFSEFLQHEVSAHSIEEVIRYIYIREIDITKSNARDISLIWNALQMSNSKCQLLIACDRLADNNVKLEKVYPNLHSSNLETRQKTLNYIIDHWKEICTNNKENIQELMDYKTFCEITCNYFEKQVGKES